MRRKHNVVTPDMQEHSRVGLLRQSDVGCGFDPAGYGKVVDRVAIVRGRARLNRSGRGGQNYLAVSGYPRDCGGPADRLPEYDKDRCPRPKLQRHARPDFSRLKAAVFTKRPLTASQSSGALPLTRKTGVIAAACSP